MKIRHIFKKIKRQNKIDSKTPLVHKDSESKNSMMGSVYAKKPQTVVEWQNEQKHKAEFNDTS